MSDSLRDGLLVIVLVAVLAGLAGVGLALLGPIAIYLLTGG